VALGYIQFFSDGYYFSILKYLLQWVEYDQVRPDKKIGRGQPAPVL